MQLKKTFKVLYLYSKPVMQQVFKAVAYLGIEKPQVYLASAHRVLSQWEFYKIDMTSVVDV